MTSTTIPNVLFARIGWMEFYNSTGNEQPIGGGKYTKSHIGHEAFNFKKVDDRLYGYFQPQTKISTVTLERISRNVIGDMLDDVLVIFVATYPRGYSQTLHGQVVVGWYQHARLFRKSRHPSPGKPRGFRYFCVAKARDCVLLPIPYRQLEIPSGKGGFGQTNVCYLLEKNGDRKRQKWFQDVIRHIVNYDGPDLLTDPLASVEKEIENLTEDAIRHSQGQGFNRDSRERRAIEDYSMRMAKNYFETLGYAVTDVSKKKAFDLLCRKAKEEIHVEVKGTSTDGSAVILTPNEVKHARKAKEKKSLYVLHSIRLNRGKASGGHAKVISPWQIEEKDLRPTGYTYKLL